MKKLQIAGEEIRSRLWLGSGLYSNPEQMNNTLTSGEPGFITLSLKNKAWKSYNKYRANTAFGITCSSKPVMALNCCPTPLAVTALKTLFCRRNYPESCFKQTG